MEELVRECIEQGRADNNKRVLELGNEILIGIIDRIIAGQEVTEDLSEALGAITEVTHKTVGSRYRNTDHAEAHSLLGKIHETGIFGTRNLRKAYVHYKTAASYSNPYGCYRLAYFYEHGISTGRSIRKAAHFYKLSANGGCGRGAHRYSMMLLEGCKGCKRDPKGAVFYLSQAHKLATKEYPHAIFDYAMCFEGAPLLDGNIIEDQAFALKLYKEGASMGCVRSMVRLANACQRGELGLDPNGGTAIEYYKQAAANKSPEAGFELFLMYRGKNRDEAHIWLKKSAEAGHPDGLRVYAEMLENGSCQRKNKLEALWWFTIADSRGSPEAKHGIKRCKRAKFQ